MDLLSFVRDFAKDVNEAQYNAKTQAAKVETMRTKLQTSLDRVKQLQQQRLRGVDLQGKAAQLEQMISNHLCQLPQPASPQPSWMQRLRAGLSILWRACIGPSSLSRMLAELQEQLALFELPGDSYSLCQHSIPFMLPERCVRPAVKADELRQKLLGRAQQPPAVVQLLGMAGMGKSVLALMVAKELEARRE